MKSIRELTTFKLIPEILDEVAKQTTAENVKYVLRNNQSPALNLVFHYVFTKDVFFIDEMPKYRPDPGDIGLSPTSLFIEMRRFYIFTSSSPFTKKIKMEVLLQMLESVHPTEAVLIGKIFKKDLGIPLLTKELVQELCPRIIL